MVKALFNDVRLATQGLGGKQFNRIDLFTEVSFKEKKTSDRKLGVEGLWQKM